MAEKTLGQVAYESQDYLPPWESIPQDAKDNWQAVADAVVAAHEARRWKAIESAPKDGSPIILRRGDRVTPGNWVEASEEEERHCWDMEGRYQGSEIVGSKHPAYWMSDDGGFTEEEPPTRWTPMPAPPKEAEHGN